LRKGLPDCTTNSKKSKSKSFIRYGSNACWIHAIAIKYKYKLDNKNVKNIVKGTPGLTISISNGNYSRYTEIPFS